MKKFKIGDKVVALTNPQDNMSQPRVKGHIYTVEAILYCNGCGVQTINIGERTNSYILRCNCGTENQSKGLYWTESKHFAKLDNLEEELKDIIENEDYEFARVLSEIIQNM